MKQVNHTKKGQRSNYKMNKQKAIERKAESKITNFNSPEDKQET